MSATVAPVAPPLVSVVVPMYNEREHIGACIEGFADQTWPKAQLEVLVVDGRSDDGSRELVEHLARAKRWVRLVDNPDRNIPAACNRGLAAARGDVVCFFSSHGVPSQTYIEASVDALRETGAAGVGGRYLHEGIDPRGDAIGAAMASPLGMASPHRFARERREVDTISHPAYWTRTVREVGGFDESMQRNEDYELNWRIRRAGGSLVFDPRIESVYRPRASLQRLARQFWWYGRFKARMVRRHPASVRPRHLVPPVAVCALGVAPVLARTRRTRRLLGVAGAAYAGSIAAMAWRERGRQMHIPTFVAAFPVMHVSWGCGFVKGVVER